MDPKLQSPSEEPIRHNIPICRLESLAAYSYNKSASDRISMLAALKLESNKHRPLEAPGKDQHVRC